MYEEEDRSRVPSRLLSIWVPLGTTSLWLDLETDYSIHVFHNDCIFLLSELYLHFLPSYNYIVTLPQVLTPFQAGRISVRKSNDSLWLFIIKILFSKKLHKKRDRKTCSPLKRAWEKEEKWRDEVTWWWQCWVGGGGRGGREQGVRGREVCIQCMR